MPPAAGQAGWCRLRWDRGRVAERGSGYSVGRKLMARQRWTVGAGMLLGLLALAVTGRADEASAVRTILDLGGAVSVATKRPGMPVVKVDLSGTKITDAGLKVLKEL